MAERNTDAGRDDGRDPIDEDAAWAAIVAGYDEEATGRGPAGEPDITKSDFVKPEAEKPDGEKPDSGTPAEPGKADGTGGPGGPGDRPLGSSITVFPAGIGPRDWTAAEPSDDDVDADGEGHFEPPEPPPLPQADTTAKFAWLAVLGGPVLLLLTVLLQWQMTWWLGTLGIGGFLGGFATLVVRMKDGDDDGDDGPGRGAVV